MHVSVLCSVYVRMLVCIVCGVSVAHGVCMCAYATFCILCMTWSMYVCQRH